jgi:TRAP-type C4-dicarboxylate transport system permease small subunit
MDGADAGWAARLNGRVTLWLARAAAFLLALIAVMTFGDVVARYFFNKPFTFTVEVTELAMGLIVYLGVGLTTHSGGHIVVDVVTLRLSERWRALLALVTNALALAFLALLVWRLWLRADLLFEKGDTTPVWLIPLWPVAFGMAAASVFLLTGVLLHLVEAWRRLAGRAPAASAAPAARPFSE